MGYWEERAVQNAEKLDRYAQNQARLATRWFQRAMREMDSRITEFTRNYGEQEGVSLQRAKILLNDPALLDDTLEDYYRMVEASAEFPGAAHNLAKLAAARRISREEFLKLQLEMIQQELFQKVQGLTLETLARAFDEGYVRECFDWQRYQGAGGAVTRLSINQLIAAVSVNWSGKNYSQRLWSQRRSLARRVDRIITTGLAAGRSQKEMRRELEREMNAGSYEARRLIRTECAYVTGQAALKSYRENGTERYKFLAVLDLSTSEVCRALDGKVFPVEDARPGVNFPPLHPHCRSRTVPDCPDKAADQGNTRAARNPDGTVSRVPAGMDYPEWYKRYVTGTPDGELREACLEHIGRDSGQYGKYRAVLGRSCPPSLEEFQKLKYTRPEEWAELKASFRRASAATRARQIHEFVHGRGGREEFQADLDFIQSKDFAQKFKGISGGWLADRRVCNAAREVLIQNDGKGTESVILLDAKSGKIKNNQQIGYFGGKIKIPVQDVTDGCLILVHNHPNNTSFSVEDIISLNDTPEIRTILAVAHNGTVFSLSIGNGKRVASSQNGRYNDIKFEWQRTFRENNQDIHKTNQAISKKYGWDYEVK